MHLDGRVAMVYNGEVYNYRVLRDELSRLGLSFSTTTDAEVLLAGFRAWGKEVFTRARGMWAAAFWEPERRRLTLARDPLGKKPLVYAVSGQRLAFASSVAALLALLDRTPSVDRDALACYLGHLNVPQEHSMFVGVSKVPPGSLIEWVPGSEVHVQRYWRVPGAPNRGPTVQEASHDVERLLRGAVRRRLESDVPIGVFLSAGYDSGLVAALAAQESGKTLVAVTAGTTGSGYDERTAAELVARRYGLDHRRLEVAPISAGALPQLIAELGEPFGDASLLPSYEVARAARREITVALTGDGGDEGFFGYATFAGVRFAARYRRLVPTIIRDRLWRATRSYTGDDWRRRLGAVFEYGRAPLATAFRNRMGFAPDERGHLLGRTEPDGMHRAEHVYEERLARWSALPDADALRRTFFETILPSDYLTKVDTATMAASLEARCPFLDVDLVEYLLGLPEVVAFAGGRLKVLLRPIVRRHLPREILGRRKAGFGVPVGTWMRGPLRPAIDELVLKPGTLMSELVSPVAAREVLHAHLAGADHATRLWGLLALGVWCAVVVERRIDPREGLPGAVRMVGGFA
jgi:asparagine synthase (glutamine-hydrolysing)